MTKALLKDRLKADLQSVVTCPISHGPYEPITMNRKAFIDICMIQLNMPFSWPNKANVDHTVCGNCEVLQAIIEGRPFEPPPGITIAPLTTLISRREIQLSQVKPKKEKKPYKEP